MAAGGWIFAYKVRDFLGLGTTSDLYQFVQLSTSWLRGQFLHDNYYGDHLAIHTYLSCPLLGVLTIPFGAFGLLLALGLAAAFSVMAIVRILRLLGVPAGFALGYALVATLMPLSVQVYQDSIYGFHVELLEPCLALWLAWFLLRKNWLGSIVLAVVTCSIKEDAPLLVVVMAVTIMIEDLVRCGGAGWRRAWATPAGAVILLAVATVPLLLWIIKSQQVGVVSASLARLHPVREAGGITSNAALFSYIIANLTVWLRSDAVIAWLGLSFAATIGFILLRPHLLVIGVATTLIAWLMQDSLLWAPRFAQSLAFFQLTGCLAFASFCRLVREKPKRSPARAVLGLAAVAGLGWGLWQQWRTVPKVTEVYRLAPSSKISPSDRNQADRLFSVYRREGRADEPVMASPYLFRYAHDRNLVWPHSLTKRPQPVWILWDAKDTPLDGLRASLVADNGVDLSAYELKGRAGDFLLYRQKSGPGLQPVPLTAPVPITGEDHGAVKMLVRFAAARAGFSEPLLSLGRTGAGDVFFVRYLNYHQLVLGMESIGDAVLTSKPIEFEADHPYTLELFSGSLLPPAVDAADAKEAARRLYLQSLVSARLDGNEVLNALATPHVVQPAEVVAGLNAAGADSAAAAFTGKISDVQRGGYPRPTHGGLADADHGAVRLVVRLPAAAAGVPEPLLVVGVPGQATLGYVRVLPGGKARFGVEIWGQKALESEEVAMPDEVATEVVFHVPALYPSVNDPRWGPVPRAAQEARRSRVVILINGRTVLDQAVKDNGTPSSPVAFGQNPVGGSWVGGQFSGRLLQVTRLELSAP
ncbi:MAG TPA: DUF2079 domain-containing protein [Lacunisphaera sp.]